MTWRRHLLWLDGAAGAAVGLAVLLALGRLAEWYGLPRGLLRVVGAANLGYGLFALTLAGWSRRPRGLVLLLIAANAGWAVACVRWVAVLADTAGPLGLLHLGAEAVFVGGLAVVEWHSREALVER